MRFVSRLFGKKEESLPRRAGAGECADDSGSAGHDILDPMMGHFMGRCIGAVRESGLKAEGTGGCSILLGGDGGPELALGPFWGRYQASQDEGVFASVVESAQRMMELGPAPTLEQPCPDDSERRACAAADEPVVPVFIPPLVTLLVHHEREKGSPLTREELLAIRENAICVTVRLSLAAEMAEKRGYADVPAETCWESWCEFRKQLDEGNPTQ